MNGRLRTITLTLLGVILTMPAIAAAPPDRINYQGVLRDAGDRPLDGDHDMVFRFMSADVGGDEILVDEHDAAHANPVTVSNGLFNVELGGGAVSDGTGPGSYTSLATVFRDHASVWLELEVGGETLAPRVRVISAAYALNADYLDGINSTALLRSNTSDSFTSGTLSMNGSTTLDINGTLRMDGPVTKASSDLVTNLNADLLDGLHSSAFAGSVHGHPGSDITSPVDDAINADMVDGKHASEFIDTSATPQTKAGELTADASALASSIGIRGLGQSAGGYFEDAGNTGYASVGAGNTGIHAGGSYTGGYFHDSNESGYAYVGHGNYGIMAYGTYMGGFFKDEDHSGYARVGYSNNGIWAFGEHAGGSFEDLDSSGYAHVGWGDVGILARGNEAGGNFKDLDHSGWARVGVGDIGIAAEGNYAGGAFSETDGSGYLRAAYANWGVWAEGDSGGGNFIDSAGSGRCAVAYGDYGIDASGNTVGGYFQDSDGSGEAWAGSGDTGVAGYGTFAGGYFADTDGSGKAWAGSGDTGVKGHGTLTGGYFLDLDGTGVAYAARDDVGLYGEGFLAGGEFRHTGEPSHVYLAYGGTGVYGGGDEIGGYIFDTDGTSYATLASGTTGIDAHGSQVGGRFSDSDSTGYANVGYGDYGISAHGSYVGGHFEDTDHSGYAYLAFGNTGIEARGSYQAGYFADSDDSAYTRVAYGDRGIWAKGTFAGGTFSHPDNVTFWADVSTSTHKIVGTGAVSFMQNHPYEEDKVIVYAVPEGDEVAVYTRGTARLVDGEAHVTLGETFQYVTNPDIGLTAHLTARGDAPVPLSVASLSTSEMTVYGPDGSDAVFDYLVYGLRLGFEELSIVKNKEKDALLPTTEAIEVDYAGHPELRSFNAMERYSRMHAEVFPESEIDLSRSHALVAALESQRPAAIARAAALEESISDDAGVIEGSEEIPEAQDLPRADVLARREQGIPDTLVADSDPEETAETGGVTMPVSVPVETGDVLVFDIEHPGMLCPVTAMADTTVAGIAVGASFTDEELGEEAPLQVQVALTGLVECKVDAGYGAVRAGDLLTTSPTPGHAMRAPEPLPGTILGKAAETLETGTGTIRVLVMPQ